MIKLAEWINSCSTTDASSLIIGDLNCLDICWESGVVSDNIQKLFYDTVCDLGFVQIVNLPTRGANILDLIVCNNPLLVSSFNLLSPFSTSDHDVVVFNLNVFINDAVTNSSQCDKDVLLNDLDSSVCMASRHILWNKADWDALGSLFANVEWFNVFEGGTSSDECWSSFMNVAIFGIDHFVPTKIKSSNQKLKKQINSRTKHYPKGITKLFRRKASLWRRLKTNKNGRLKARYNQLSLKCMKALAFNEMAAEHNILKSGDLGKFYKFVNSKFGNRTGIGVLQDIHGSYLYSNIDKANVLNRYFASVCTLDNNIIPAVRTAPVNNTVETVVFKVTEIFKILKKQKKSLSAGPDGLPPIFFKMLAKQLATPLTYMFNHIFTVGLLPSVWKKALVTPIFKSGTSSSAENYRPISLTCVACKVFETVVKATIIHYLNSNHVLSDMQHGFLSRKSTCTNLLESVNDWTINLMNGSLTRVVYIDFRKAFDSCSHSKLLFKLSHYGIRGKLLGVIQSFLSNRSQKVVIDGISSKDIDIVSGVPQGSVLGPILFIVFINDLAEIFTDNVAINCFADDAKLFTELKSMSDWDDMKHCLDNLKNWADSWQLQISYKKCAQLDISSARIVSSFPQNTIGEEPICKILCTTDLGVTVDNNLNFSTHIATMVSKAKQRIGLLFRAFKSRVLNFLLIGFKSYILPLVSYCSPVWSPYQIGDILAIESVQQLFSRRVPGLESIGYAERLIKLSLPTLELRRLRADLLLCYKILHGLVDVKPDKLGLHLASSECVTRGHNFKLAKSHSRISARLNFFGCRIVDPWNSLPVSLVNACSAVVFKQELYNCDLSKFLVIKY
jgi:hypothetical protein